MFDPRRLFLALAASLLVPWIVAAEPPSRPVLSGRNAPSKLGLLYLVGHKPSQPMIDIADAGVVPILKTDVSDLTHGDSIARRVKKANPKAIVVGAACETFDENKEEPEAAAGRVWAKIKPRLDAIPAEARKDMDFVEAWPNMWEPHDAKVAAWYCAYTKVLAARIAEAGYRPVVLTSGVGGLPVEPEILDAMAPALRYAKKVGGAWACHGYTTEYTTDAGRESWYSLRYRKAYEHFRAKLPDLADFPMILSEGGVDKEGNPEKDGWQARGTPEQYEKWLEWYDGELRKDPQVLGVTLFKIGAKKTWPSFDMEPVVPWMIEYLKKRK